MGEKPKLIDKLESALPREGRTLLRAVLTCAGHYDLRLFLVGGPVRDLLLERPPLDIDIAVEGDAVMLAHAVAREAGAKVAKSTEFGTAAIHFEGFVLDLATARAETYPRPGALPRVRPATIDADLLRRDFTCNAVALELNGPSPGKTRDPIGGVQDIRAGQVRVLHDRSFQDDATRLIRAVRYETRLRFRLEESTYDLLRRDLSYLDTISGTRIRRELTRTLEEADPSRAFARLRKLGVLAAIHPDLHFSDQQAEALHRWRAGSGPVNTAWTLLAWETPDAAVPDLIRRFALPRKAADAVEAVPAARKLEKRLARPLKPSALDELLSALPPDTVAALAHATSAEPVRTVAQRYLATRNIRPALRGDDLVALGVPQGPDVGDVLRRLRVAKLDGEVKTRADEQRLVKQYLAR